MPADEGGYDPMRQFVELAGDVRNPYPMFAGIREDSPVMEVQLGPDAPKSLRNGGGSRARTW